MELKVIESGRDELHEKALYALFDGFLGNRKRMAEADDLYDRLSHRGELALVVPPGKIRALDLINASPKKRGDIGPFGG